MKKLRKNINKNIWPQISLTSITTGTLFIFPYFVATYAKSIVGNEQKIMSGESIFLAST